jgi:hypothetical protein
MVTDTTIQMKKTTIIRTMMGMTMPKMVIIPKMMGTVMEKKVEA